MKNFLDRHSKDIVGVLSGFDRVLFRGTFRWISTGLGMAKFLGTHGILLKDYGEWSSKMTAVMTSHAEKVTRQKERPYEHLRSSAVDKSARAQEIAERDRVTKGLICVFGVVEPCHTMSLRKDKNTGHLVIKPEVRRCLWLYWYFMDREFGLMHIRVQTWAPFTTYVCINGRSYLERQLQRENIEYEKVGNCFPYIDDLDRANQLIQQLDKRDWRKTLDVFARQTHGLLANDCLHQLRPYWSITESEHATDVMFRDRATLESAYSALSDYAIRNFLSQDILRFMSRRTTRNFSGEVDSSYAERIEGVRVKHKVNKNSLKMYDKGSILRVETTINNPRDLRVMRKVDKNGVVTLARVRMRKGVTDCYPRAQAGYTANMRYLEALAVVGEQRSSREVLDKVSQPVHRNGKRYRGLRPVTFDAEIISVLANGNFALTGFQNADVRTKLIKKSPKSTPERRRQSGRATRFLRLLRIHRIIRKVAGRNRYCITSFGYLVIAATTAARSAPIGLV